MADVNSGADADISPGTFGEKFVSHGAMGSPDKIHPCTMLFGAF